ncbi:MAG: GHKL domain-containing protein [Eisenbergiella sp.]
MTTKEKAEGHGYGLRSVRDVVELYGGHIQISHEDGIFRVTIWIGHLSGAAAYQWEKGKVFLVIMFCILRNN